MSARAFKQQGFWSTIKGHFSWFPFSGGLMHIPSNCKCDFTRSIVNSIYTWKNNYNRNKLNKPSALTIHNSQHTRADKHAPLLIFILLIENSYYFINLQCNWSDWRQPARKVIAFKLINACTFMFLYIVFKQQIYNLLIFWLLF